MALDPEELKKRRQARAAQRLKRQRQFRMTLIGIGAGLVLVIAAAIIIASLTRTPVPADENPSNSASETAAPPQTTVRLAFGGDLNITDKVIASAGNGYDYTEAFMDVAPILADADVTALNFEGSLCGAPYGTADRSAPQGLAEALDAAGVDILQLANSYSLNQGLQGLGTTIDAVRTAGMEPLGVYADRAQRDAGQGFLMVEVQGIRIAYVAFTKGMDGTTLPAGNEGCVNVLYTDYNSTYQQIDTDGILSVLNRVHAQNPDYIVAMLHWGSEYNDTVSASQRSIASLLKENGVNAVIGTHPHYLHEMSYDEANDFFVAYSLGDFFGDADRAGTQYSVILELSVTRDETTGQTQLSDFSYTPIYLSTEADARILRIREAMTAYENGYISRVSQSAYEDMAYSLTRIEDRVVAE